MLRGINRQDIFYDEEDYKRFIEALKRYKKVSGYEIYAFCLMKNHVHILIKDSHEPLEQLMRRIAGSFVYWYNRKYNRIGNLFQDRFRSEPVNNDSYFLTVLRYIHQNPIKAGITTKIENYRWSSYFEYIHKADFVDTLFALKMYDSRFDQAILAFQKNQNEVNRDYCLELEGKRCLSDDEVKTIVKESYGIKSMTDIKGLDLLARNSIIKQIKAKPGISIRQLERLTGINRGTIQQA